MHIAVVMINRVSWMLLLISGPLYEVDTEALSIRASSVYADSYKVLLDVWFNKIQYGPDEEAALWPGRINVRQILINEAFIKEEKMYK